MPAFEYDLSSNAHHMANLSIRNLDSRVYALIQRRSVEHHVSMEEEVRRILTDTLAAPSIADIFQAHFGQENGVDLDGLINDNASHAVGKNNDLE